MSDIQILINNNNKLNDKAEKQSVLNTKSYSWHRSHHVQEIPHFHTYTTPCASKVQKGVRSLHQQRKTPGAAQEDFVLSI